MKPALNVWQQACEDSPSLAKAPSQKPSPIKLPVFPREPLTTAARAYFRSLRAAEMAAWEASGGDVLRSFAHRPEAGDATEPVATLASPTA